ncbi:tRNA lysidine(34) synthetase TilS [Amycolatopsis sp. FDAARGOS 1241]|uniref:tRNA lysidine(34) synthetase TilS n=1 Tax=Amycolatopsis sp. FDAARGOS 1241 TaxID=2778070 RepID=UPI001951EBE3|nr:tRNA lysidine(34) synthetase TilS [Amycolatopsis sp. FDAARGOS 1241]QRP46588.1 tRNA lysidine(34) synthetase TilS [Amycolatopsis sp. FDAARGOS 1241]
MNALAAVRRAVREFLATAGVPDEVCVAVSGGADSLALAEATAYVARHRKLRTRALVVDHGLQDGSAEVAARAATVAKEFGLDTAEVLTVSVTGKGGPEAAARTARYRALREALPGGEGLVLLGHTLDDQAETVLLGLGRGSGPRSLAGMRPHDPPWGRPLLAITRAQTREACAELGVEPWQDPHNADPRFTRVRLRAEVLPLLEDVLAGGVAGALARTAAQLREDAEALDTVADRILTRASGAEGLDVAVLAAEPAAVRRRVLRRWLLASGVRELTDAHLRSVDALVARWRGQGGVWLPGNLEARRCRGRLTLAGPEPTTRGE